MKHALAALALLAAAPGGCRDAPSAPADKPEIHLLTSLPLLFGESFSLEAERPAVTALLEDRYRLTPIDLPSQLPQGATLLAIQPRALPAEELVALDDWVRGGGRLLLLADPRLEWPSDRPLGDRLRPLPMFADTGLLGHWGLRLDAPDKAGPVKVDGVTVVSPGRLVATSGQCKVDRHGLTARCRLGKGRAVIVADADWLSEELAKANESPFESHGKALEKLIEATRG